MNVKTRTSILALLAFVSLYALIVSGHFRKMAEAQNVAIKALRKDIEEEVHQGMSGVGEQIQNTPMGNRPVENFGENRLVKEHWGKAAEKLTEFARLKGVETDALMRKDFDMGILAEELPIAISLRQRLEDYWDKNPSKPGDVSLPPKEIVEIWMNFTLCANAIARSIHEPEPFPGRRTK